MARRTFTREFKVQAYPQGYIEGFDELRTKLAVFFSILTSARLRSSPHPRPPHDHQV
ncbi:MAG: hypothetical protein JW394_0574 [Nitrospira sp.]|jgi:hypothetical protein|nr:hypothetical protein [Nitrospira sp.]